MKLSIRRSLWASARASASASSPAAAAHPPKTPHLAPSAAAGNLDAGRRPLASPACLPSPLRSPSPPLCQRQLRLSLWALRRRGQRRHPWPPRRDHPELAVPRLLPCAARRVSPMSIHLRSALRAARLRWVPRLQLPVDRSEPRGSPALTWGVTPIGLRNLRPYSAAPSRSSSSKEAMEDKDEEDKRIRQLESRRVFRAAQRAFLDYLHVTRGLCFGDAEHIAKHSPIFISTLLETVKDAMEEPVEGGEETVFKSKAKRKEMTDERVSKAIVRLFRYHPINEFEPFLESIGLKPNEYDALLPRDLMFLADDPTLLGSYHALCNYGVDRTKIGRIYREAYGVFISGESELLSKLRSLEDLGFSKTTVIKLLVSCPVILTYDPNMEFKILQWLDDIGIQRDWISQFLSASNSYNWRKMIEVPQFFSELGFIKEGIGKLIRKNPDFLFDGSGRVLFTVVITMLKAGFGKKQLFNLFLDFPDVPARDFTRNIQRGIVFLADIGLSEEDINKFLVSHASVLGSVQLKKANSILTNLSVGKTRLCKIIMKEPSQLLQYAVGSKLSRLPPHESAEASLKEKVKFLKRIGFVEGSVEMKKALKAFRGKGDELQDRYEFLVKAGLDQKDVVNMIKVAPQVLNQKIDVLEYKISFLVNEIGYPLSSLVRYPSYLSFTIARTKARFLMYNWLQERGLAAPNFALSTILASSETNFVNYLVKKHDMGPEVWERFKREAASMENMPCTSDD
ncbi:hypothetical protein ACP4OV_005559 [Aristida adscensionis]